MRFKILVFFILQGCGGGGDSPTPSAERAGNRPAEAVTAPAPPATPAGTSTTPAPAVSLNQAPSQALAGEKGPCPQADKHKALFTAVSQGDAPLARCLIEKGARVNQRTDHKGMPDDTGFSFLCVAIAYDQPAMIKLLVSKGALVNDLCSPQTEFYSIHAAAMRGTKETLQALIESGADIDRRTYTDGMTPLMAATENNNFSNVELLVSRGAKVDAYSKKLGTAFTLAKFYGYRRIARHILSACRRPPYKSEAECIYGSIKLSGG